MRKVLVAAAVLAGFVLAGCESRVFHVRRTWCDMRHSYVVADTVTGYPCP